jgi:methionyl-tRNA formyltransferase
MTKQDTIALLCADGDSTRAIYNALRAEFQVVKVIMEQPVPRTRMAKRRAKRLGVVKVLGQVLFIACVVPVLRRSAASRIREIEEEFGLAKELPEDVIRVDSINSEAARKALREIDPAVIVVSGTRIIGKETLESVDAPFINMHAGITPLYRGVHGAYWALTEDQPKHVGTTVHLVDKGIDTGNIIDQAHFAVTEKDNFATYPYLHTAHGIPVLLNAVHDALDGELKVRTEPSGLDSKLRYHPSIWEYGYYRIRRGVA